MVASLVIFDRKNWEMEIPGNRNVAQRESISSRIEGIFKY